LLKFKLGHYLIVTRRLAEFSAQKAAREAHQNEQALARTALRLDNAQQCTASWLGKPWLARLRTAELARLRVKGGSQGPPFFIRGAYWPVTGPRGAARCGIFASGGRAPIRAGLF
jgi:hypothetical protein